MDSSSRVTSVDALSSQDAFVRTMKGLTYQYSDMMSQWTKMLTDAADFALSHPANVLATTLPVEMTRGCLQYAGRNFGPHEKHEFNFDLSDQKVRKQIAKDTGIDEASALARTIDGEPVDVEIEVVDEQSFGNLKHLKILDHDGNEHAEPRPPLLIISPMSGHFDTLLTDTVHRMMQDYDVYVTDWKNAKHIPLEEGEFGLSDYTSYLKDKWLPMINMRHQPEGTDEDNIAQTVHTLAVCQPGVSLLAATAMMSEDESPHTPASVTMMGSPIDTQVSPGSVNEFAEQHDMDWFRKNTISTTGPIYDGAGRDVYSGTGQLLGFMSMNKEKHEQGFKDMAVGMAFAPWNDAVDALGLDHVSVGDGDKAESIAAFYDEFLTVGDLSAKFYLETIEAVFKEHHMANGSFKHTDPETQESRIVDLSAITHTALFTVEGENDDITGRGQTSAAHDLAPNIPDDMRQHLEQEKVGHYGLFSGTGWRQGIAPEIIDFTRRVDEANGLNYHMSTEQENTLTQAGLLNGVSERREEADLAL